MALSMLPGQVIVARQPTGRVDMGDLVSGTPNRPKERFLTREQWNAWKWLFDGARELAAEEAEKERKTA